MSKQKQLSGEITRAELDALPKCKGGMTKQNETLVLKSKCCNASVKVVGDVTKHYQCLVCGKPCDLNYPDDTLSSYNRAKQHIGREKRRFVEDDTLAKFSLNKIQRERIEMELALILTPPVTKEIAKKGVKDWSYEYNREGLNYLIKQILELFERELKGTTWEEEMTRKIYPELSEKEIQKIIDKKPELDSKCENSKEFCNMVNKLYKYDREKRFYIDTSILKQFISDNFEPKSEVKKIVKHFYDNRKVWCDKQRTEAYREGFNQRLKEEGKVGKKWQHLYL